MLAKSKLNSIKTLGTDWHGNKSWRICYDFGREK